MAIWSKRGAFLQLMALGPVLVLILIKYHAHLYAVHLSFIVPVAIVNCIWLVQRLPGIRSIACFLIVFATAAGGFVTQRGHDFYDQDGVVAKWWYMGDYKQMASIIEQDHSDDTFYCISGNSLYPALLWYINQNAPKNVLNTPRIYPTTQDAHLRFILPYGPFGNYFDGLAEFQKIFPKGESAKVAGFTVYEASVKRRGIVFLDASQSINTFSMLPQHFYRDVFFASQFRFFAEGFGSIDLPFGPGYFSRLAEGLWNRRYSSHCCNRPAVLCP